MSRSDDETFRGDRKSGENAGPRVLFTLRPAGSEDHEFLRHLAREGYREVVRRQFGAWDEKVQGARFDAKLAHSAFRVVEVRGKPVGAVWTTEFDDHLFLHDLMVLPGFQRSGIGSAVLEHELARAERAAKPIRLHTLKLNEAQELYARYGFTVTSIDDVYVHMERAARRVP